MERRKFLLGVGSFAAAGAAAMGTGAFEGAYVNGERSMDVSVTGDENAYIGLIPTSPYASTKQAAGGWERGQGGTELTLTFDRLNSNMDSRFDDVFRVRNTTGDSVKLSIGDEPDWNGASQWESAFQVWAQPSSGSAVRLDDGGYIELGPGQMVEINIFILLGQYDPNGHEGMQSLTITADGTDSNA